VEGIRKKGGLKRKPGEEAIFFAKRKEGGKERVLEEKSRKHPYLSSQEIRIGSRKKKGRDNQLSGRKRGKKKGKKA